MCVFRYHYSTIVPAFGSSSRSDVPMLIIITTHTHGGNERRGKDGRTAFQGRFPWRGMHHRRGTTCRPFPGRASCRPCQPNVVHGVQCGACELRGDLLAFPCLVNMINMDARMDGWNGGGSGWRGIPIVCYREKLCRGGGKVRDGVYCCRARIVLGSRALRAMTAIPFNSLPFVCGSTKYVAFNHSRQTSSSAGTVLLLSLSVNCNNRSV